MASFTATFIFILVLFVVLRNFVPQKRFIGRFLYYQNFISFISHQKDVSSYQSFFDDTTPRDYAIASYINMHATDTDNIVVWGNNAQIYKMTKKLPPGRFTVAYHASYSEETLKETHAAIAKSDPRFIIVITKNYQLPYSLTSYIPRIMIQDTTIYEKYY